MTAQERLSRIERFPTLPIVVHQMQTLIANPKSDMSQIATLIGKDQAIASRIIRLVNSAFYGLREHVGSIRQAIVVLGVNTVRNLVIETAVVKIFSELPTHGFDRQKFWLSTFACAQGAKMLAQLLRRPEPEDYFLAGLVHDIGILAIDQFLHPEFDKILEETAAGRDLVEAERKVLGLTHAEAGAQIAGRWKVPDWLVQTIRYHHEPDAKAKDAEAHKDKIAVVHLADCNARACHEIRFLPHFGPKRNPCAALSRLRIREEQVKTIFEEVRKGVVALGKEWGIALA